MRRNISGQFVGAQMVSASDGSAFTGSVTCYVTGDAGTQAAGSVGSGACTHEGNGFHTYAPAQAETNYTHVAFTFTGSGAVPVTVQIYPVSYDANGRFDVGALGGDAQSLTDLKDFADAGYDPSTNKVQGVVLTDTVTTYTGNTPQTGDAYARLGAPAGASVSADVAAVKSETATILADTNELQTNQGNWVTATGFSTLDASGVRTAVGLASANLDTQLGNLPTANENADALLDRNVAGGSSTGRTVKEALYFLRNRWTIAGGTLTVYATDDSTSAWTSAVTQTAGNPVSESDPA